MGRRFIMLAAINGFLAVALGAFGAHILKSRLSEALFTIFQTGVQYHGLHAVALLGVGILALDRTPPTTLRIAGWSFLSGILLFSGSLYLLALSGVRGIGMITPLGGTAFLIGWGALALSARSLSDSHMD